MHRVFHLKVYHNDLQNEFLQVTSPDEVFLCPCCDLPLNASLNAGAIHRTMSAAAPAPGPSPVATEDYVTSAVTDTTTGGPWIDINTQYLLASAYLVFFMHCGFAMVSPLPSP